MWIKIDKKSDITLMRQIYTAIKNMILNEKLSSGEKLPSTRLLSKELSVSRTTVLDAYNQLIAEGYLKTHQGSGTVVAEGIYKINKNITSKSIEKSTDSTSHIINFKSGTPDLNNFPIKEFANLYKKVLLDLSPEQLKYQDPQGIYSLRETISQYLFRERGINCNPKNIMITSGSTQALSLISKLLYKKQNKVIVEDPTHPGLTSVISENGFDLLRIEADEKGLNTYKLPSCKNISFVYTTPSHQYPLGGILPIQRRLALIDYANKNNCYIVEDDYDSEFRFEGQPVDSLYELNHEKVIYLGSLSKILIPSLRLGYMILPDNLINKYSELKLYSDVHTESLSQYVLNEFIKNGSLEKHIWNMKKLYSKKRNHIIKELNNNFPNMFELKGTEAGMHVIVHFKNIIFTKRLIESIKDIKIYPVENYSFINKDKYKNEILLGYAHLTLDEISEGIKKLRESIL